MTRSFETVQDEILVLAAQAGDLSPPLRGTICDSLFIAQQMANDTPYSRNAIRNHQWRTKIGSRIAPARIR